VAKLTDKQRTEAKARAEAWTTANSAASNRPPLKNSGG
jgi:hypothetical protein